MRALLAGTDDRAPALAAALSEAGADAELSTAEDLPETMTTLETRLSDGAFDGAVAVGTGEASLALAIAAAKLGVPLAACLGDAPDPDSPAGAEHRILGTLAAESVELGAAPQASAERLLAWLGDAA